MFSKSLLAFVSAALACSASATAAATYSAVRVPSHYTEVAAAPGAQTFSYDITLKGENEDALDDKLVEISTSGGSWLSEDELAAYITPKAEHVSALKAHLASAGVAEQDITSSKFGDRIRVKSTIAQANKAWSTTLKHYSIAKKGVAIRAPSYTVPDELQDFVVAVHPFTSFDVPRQFLPTGPVAADNEEAVVPRGFNSTLTARAECNSEYVTAACLRQQYGLASYNPSSSGQGLDILLLAYSGEASISTSDLNQYINQFRPSAKGYKLDIKSAPGAGSNDPSQVDQESDLDVQTAVGLAAPLKAGYFLANGDNSDFSTDLTNSLTAILDEYSPLPGVVSVSYGVSEDDVSSSDAQAFCAAAKKLVAQGTTLIYASGDGGLEGGHDEGRTCSSSGFGVSYPSGCPYVLSVGATIGFNPPSVAANIDNSGFYSSSGFSNYFSTPSWQKSALNSYRSHIPSQNKGLYNPNGRVFPDVSANGWGFVTIYQGQQTTVGGTSASAPAVGAVLALVNNYRKAHGKGTLGFANPTFYQNSWAWTDVTAGSASGCDDSSDYKFPATSGWDAASGLGLPNLQQLFKLP